MTSSQTCRQVTSGSSARNRRRRSSAAPRFSHWPVWAVRMTCSAKAYMPPRSQGPSGTGKPSLARSAAAWGSRAPIASLSANLVVPAAVFSTRASRAATASTSRSRNGVRNSRPCAMAIRSALTRMSPGSHVLMSTSCMVATSSRPASAACRYTGSVTSNSLAFPCLTSSRAAAARYTYALPM
jgi:hypothetical protein